MFVFVEAPARVGISQTKERVRSEDIGADRQERPAGAAFAGGMRTVSPPGSLAAEPGESACAEISLMRFDSLDGTRKR